MGGVLVAHAPYYNAAGKRVPSVTTIIGQNLAWNKDVLMGWAWRQGRDGKEFRETANYAANIGTVAHSMVEHDILETDLNVREAWPGLTDAQYELAQVSFKGYKTWKQRTTLNLVKTELSLVSEKYQFGGMIDTIAVLNNEEDDEHEVVDWKTSNGTYADHVIQATAYGHLYEEVKQKKVTGIHICRFGKDVSGFHHHYWPLEALDPAWNVFTHLRAIHHYKWIVEKLK